MSASVNEAPKLVASKEQAVAVSAAFLSLFAIVGFALYGLPFFYDFFVRDLGWTRQQVTSGNALSKLLVGPLFGLLAGTMVDRFGPRRLMLIGIVIAGAALIGLGGVHTLSAFYFFYLLNAVGYVLGGPLPSQVLLSRWFDKSRGKAMGIAYLGIGIGGALVPQIANALTQTMGWRGALRAIGVLIIVIALPAAIFVREAPPLAAAAAGSAPPSLMGALRQPAFYLLAIGSMASIGAVGGTMQNLKLYLSLDRKLAQGEIANVLTIILVGSIAGRLLMGWLADRWAKKHVMLLVYAIVAVTIPALAFAPSIVMIKVCAFLFGIGLGGDYMVIPLMAAELFGLRILGRLMGIVLTADGVAEAVVPWTVAAVRESTGSYSNGFALLAGLAAVGAVAVGLLPRRARVDDSGTAGSVTAH